MILSSRSKIVFSSMPLYGAGMGFALKNMTFVMGFTRKKQRPLKAAAWMVAVTFAFPTPEGRRSRERWKKARQRSWQDEGTERKK
jgi:hypothetical protein